MSRPHGRVKLHSHEWRGFTIQRVFHPMEEPHVAAWGKCQTDSGINKLAPVCVGIRDVHVEESIALILTEEVFDAHVLDQEGECGRLARLDGRRRRESEPSLTGAI